MSAGVGAPIPQAFKCHRPVALGEFLAVLDLAPAHGAHILAPAISRVPATAFGYEWLQASLPPGDQRYMLMRIVDYNRRDDRSLACLCAQLRHHRSETGRHQIADQARCRSKDLSALPPCSRPVAMRNFRSRCDHVAPVGTGPCNCRGKSGRQAHVGLPARAISAEISARVQKQG